MPRSSIRAVLSGGDRRSLGHAAEALAALRRQPSLSRTFIALLRDTDPIVRLRAADTLEKFSRDHAGALQRFKRRLLTLLRTEAQQELQWHLAQMLPRLHLADGERRRAFKVFEGYLRSPSSIVRTSALQALVDLSTGDLNLAVAALRHLTHARRRGTPAMRARARRLLPRLRQTVDRGKATA